MGFIRRGLEGNKGIFVSQIAQLCTVNTAGQKKYSQEHKSCAKKTEFCMNFDLLFFLN